jgi:signal transduction histidine kinase
MTYAGQDSSTREPMDLSLLVREMLELLKISISKHATLRVDLPPNLPPIHANAAQLRQVIMNLITNASEALGGAEGVISISVSSAPEQPSSAENGFSAVTDCLRLTISDTGSGMTPDVLSRIFDPFYTTKFSGRGLGRPDKARGSKSWCPAAAPRGGMTPQPKQRVMVEPSAARRAPS